MDIVHLLSRLRIARNEKGFTQKQLANKLGVTEQAISKYERGICFPDIEILDNIPQILKCSLDYLFQFEKEKRVSFDQNNIEYRNQMKTWINPDIISLSFGKGLVDLFLQEKEKDFPHVISIRKQISLQWGIMIPLIRIMDNLNLSEMEYEIKIHGIGVGGIKNINISDPEKTLGEIFHNLKEKLLEHIHLIVNNQIIFDMIEIIREEYPAVVDQVVPEKISYSLLRDVIIELLRVQKCTAYPGILIIQILERYENSGKSYEELAEIVRKDLGEKYLLENWAK